MSVDPVTKEIVVAASQERAFDVFTRLIDSWWPRQHHIGKSPMARTAIEPQVGGRWYSVCQDGSECDVGRVLTWDPPRRLVLAWQIDAHWNYDPGFVTEVEVVFVAEGAKQTRVTLEHRNLDRYGAAAAKYKELIDAPGGWGLILRGFAEKAAA